MYKDFDTIKTKPNEDDRKLRSPSERPSQGTGMHSSNIFGSPENYLGTPYANETLDLEYKSSYLGAKLSELEDTYKNQMNRQVLNSMSNLHKKVVEDMKADMDAKLARQGEEHVTMTEKLKLEMKEEFNKSLKKQRDEYVSMRDNLQNEMKLEINARLMKQREEYLQLKDNLYAQIKTEMTLRFAKQSEDLLLTKENILAQLRSEMSVKFAKQGEEVAVMRENMQNQLREEVDDKLAIHSDELIMVKEDFQAHLQNLNADMTRMQEKIELNLSKDIHGLKTKVFEMIDSYSEKFQTIWTTIDSINKHLGVKVDSNNGELSILRESVERFRHSSGSPERESGRFSRTSLTTKQPQVEFLKENLNRIADKLRVYREAIYAVTKNQGLTQSHWRIHQRELHLQGVSLEEACEQVVTMDELAMIVKAVILEQKREAAKLKDVVDENAVAQNNFNASLANKVKDLEEVTAFAQENFNSLSEDFNLFVAQESHNTEVGINKRENLRRDLDKLAFRLEELSENYKHITDPIALTRLQKMIWSMEKPELKDIKQHPEPIIADDLGERMGAMEYVMWRYARHFVEPEAMKRIAKISRVTVPVYEKLENLLFLIKNCGFVEPRTVRHAIRVFKEAIARLGRRCIKEKQDAFEEVWKLIQETKEVDTVYYYYLMEVFSSLVSEEKTNMDRAYELSVFEYLFECLRRKDASQPAQACMLKTLWVLCKTEAHIEFIQRTHLVPDLLVLCGPHLETYGKSLNPDPSISPLSQLIEEKNQTLNFDSNDISEIDGMYVKTALVYYSLRLFSEIFKKAPLVQQVDLTHLLQSVLRLLKRTILLHNIKELCLIVLHRVHINNPGKYMNILCIPECLELLDYNSEDPSLSKEAKTCTQELVTSLREAGGSNFKTTPNSRATVSSGHHNRAKSVKHSKPMVTISDFKVSPTKLPLISQRAIAVLEKNFKAKLYERSDKLTDFLQRKLDPSTTTGPEVNIYNKTRKERLLKKNKFNDSDYTTVISKTGLMTCIPRNSDRKAPGRTLKTTHSSNLYPTYTQGEESFEETIRRSRDVSPDLGVVRERMFHSFIEGESHVDSEEEQTYMEPKSVENQVRKANSSQVTKEELNVTVKDAEGKKSEYTFRETQKSSPDKQTDSTNQEPAKEQQQ